MMNYSVRILASAILDQPETDVAELQKKRKKNKREKKESGGKQHTPRTTEGEKAHEQRTTEFRRGGKKVESLREKDCNRVVPGTISHEAGQAGEPHKYA